MKLIIDIDEETYKSVIDNNTVYVLDEILVENAIANGTPLDDIRSKILYEIYMDGVNMDNEYHGCWVRFKNIETIVNRYMRERSEDEVSD